MTSAYALVLEVCTSMSLPWIAEIGHFILLLLLLSSKYCELGCLILLLLLPPPPLPILGTWLFDSAFAITGPRYGVFQDLT